MRNVVAGFDGSEESRDALRLARQLADAEGATLNVATVLLDEDPAAERQGFERRFSQARAELGDHPFAEQPLRDVSAPRALSEYTEKAGSDLLVLGSSRHGAIGRVLFGSVGERLLNGSSCAIAIAPRGYAVRDHFGFGIVGVAYDGSPESTLALGAAARLAEQLDDSLRLIAVAPQLTASGRISGTTPGFEKLLTEEFSTILERGRASVGDGVPAETALEHGDPAETLAEQGVELDLLVVGSRRYGPLRRVLLGGVSAQLMRTAPCPVLITPRTA